MVGMLEGADTRFCFAPTLCPEAFPIKASDDSLHKSSGTALSSEYQCRAHGWNLFATVHVNTAQGETWRKS